MAIASVAVETPPRIDLRARQRDQLGVRPVRGLADNRDLPVTELVRRIDDDPVAWCEPVSGDHDSGAVGTEDARLRYGREALANPDVQVVERRRAQLDQDLSGAWHRIGGVFVAEHFGAPVLVNAHGFHGAQSRI